MKVIEWLCWDILKLLVFDVLDDRMEKVIFLIMFIFFFKILREVMVLLLRDIVIVLG